jgi:hypothetical protein
MTHGVAPARCLRVLRWPRAGKKIGERIERIRFIPRSLAATSLGLKGMCLFLCSLSQACAHALPRCQHEARL